MLHGKDTNGTALEIDEIKQIEDAKLKSTRFANVRFLIATYIIVAYAPGQKHYWRSP